MKNREYRPYKFNFKYEYKTYKNIGVEDKILYKAKKNVFYRLRLGIRRLFNWDDKKYKNLNKFSEWEKYVNSIRPEFSNNTDFIHFLKDSARHYDVKRNMVGSIVTPLYVVMMSSMLTIFLLPDGTEVIFEHVLLAWVLFSVILVLTLLFLLRNNYKNNKLYFFYMDYIKVIEEKDK